MTEVRQFSVTGMSCAHCEKAIREEVGQLPGVSAIDVSFDSDVLRVTTVESGPSDVEIIAAVDEAGYDAQRRD